MIRPYHACHVGGGGAAGHFRECLLLAVAASSKLKANFESCPSHFSFKRWHQERSTRGQYGVNLHGPAMHVRELATISSGSCSHHPARGYICRCSGALHSSTFQLNLSVFCALHAPTFRLDVSTFDGLCLESWMTKMSQVELRSGLLLWLQ